MSQSPLNTQLIKILGDLNKVLENSPFDVHDNAVDLISNRTTLARITPSDILLGDYSFQNHVIDAHEKADIHMKGNFTSFLNSISKKIERLNHIGISYFCEDVDNEVEKIKTVANENNLHLYEEQSGDPMQRWLFAGDASNWKAPLFEIVLSRGEKAQEDYWRPHFQIDINTKMNIEEIKKVTDKFLESDFIRWQLDIPNYETVLAMGILGEVNGTKIALGIGTNKRGTEYHRKHELKPLF